MANPETGNFNLPSKPAIPAEDMDYLTETYAIGTREINALLRGGVPPEALTDILEIRQSISPNNNQYPKTPHNTSRQLFPVHLARAYVELGGNVEAVAELASRALLEESREQSRTKYSLEGRKSSFLFNKIFADLLQEIINEPK